MNSRSSNRPVCTRNNRKTRSQSLWIPMLAGFAIIAAAVASPQGTGQDHTPTWIGPSGQPLPFSTDEEVLEFLRTAEIVQMENIPEGWFEVDFERLERRGIRQIGTALGIYVLILVAAWFGAGLLEPESRNQQVFITLLLSAASVGIVVPALRTTNRTATRLGQLTLITAVVAGTRTATPSNSASVLAGVMFAKNAESPWYEPTCIC